MIIVHHLARSSGPQPHQSQRRLRVPLLTQKFGVTAADLRDAIKKVGNSAKVVEAELEK
jgi:hypothetical protein